ncbi:hypothetical protein N7462_000394 [Penicillium macrosclerotiorum]|uniref:uncharacterized protein n=1 Tax=Penicillium macrosclerotiorum TaxID=303699 RepID=UPI002548A178|nr:uncharacterized protein N7462_000394 [Penicillium macrosclerotiorum]KAJ5698389.1 hypothetical protein N7462_000394 [Penicillium macrosclerotiorum]
MSLLTLCDDSPTYLSDDPGRWACANVVLALGHMLLVKRDSNTQIDDHYQKSWIFMKNALPLAQNDEDINIDIPSWPSENLAYATSKEGNTGFSAFKSYCELSVIKGKVHKHLYSVTRTEKPTSEFNSSVIMLDRKLQKWKESLPKEYRPSVKTTPTFPKSLVSVILLNLHFSYFYCIMAVHRMVTLQNLDINIQLAKSYCYGSLPDDLAILSGSLCQDAARASIRLIKYIPNSNMSITGILLHYLIAASSFLSTSIIQNSRFASHAWDIMLITQVENFMSSLILDTPNEGMKRLVGHCATYRSLAEKAAQKNVKN